MLQHHLAVSLLEYDPHSGCLSWKPKSGDDRASKIWNARFAGKEAGSIAEVSGQPGCYYRTVRLFGRLYMAHRLIWFIVTGEWPEDRVDHKDRDGLNNRWTNLRHATAQQNQFNRTIRSDNPGRFKGVRWVRRLHRFQARITVSYRNIHLGVFDDDVSAARAYDRAALKYHGEFACLSFATAPQPAAL